MAKVRSSSETLQRCFLDAWDMFTLSATRYLVDSPGKDSPSAYLIMHSLCTVVRSLAVTISTSGCIVTNKHVLKLLKRDPCDIERHVVAKRVAVCNMHELSFDFDI